METTASSANDGSPARIQEDLQTLHRNYWAIFAMPAAIATRLWRRLALGPLERQAEFNGAVTRLLIHLRAHQRETDRVFGELSGVRAEIEGLRAEIQGLRDEVARRVSETEENHVGLTEILRSGLGRRIENLGERHALELARVHEELATRVEENALRQLELARLVNAALGKLDVHDSAPG